MTIKIEMLEKLKVQKCLDNNQLLDNKKKIAKDWFANLRDEICASFEKIENNVVNLRVGPPSIRNNSNNIDVNFNIEKEINLSKLSESDIFSITGPYLKPPTELSTGPTNIHRVPVNIRSC